MLTNAKNSIVLLQGLVDESLFDEFKKKKIKEVFLLEGRPSLEAGEKSTRSLLKRKISPTVISDNMAGFLFERNLVKEVWLAYQVIERDGALCDIGALILGVLGRKHRVPVYLYPSGRNMKKSRFLGNPKDIFYFKKWRTAPEGIKGYVPLVEWLPAKYITQVHP